MRLTCTSLIALLVAACSGGGESTIKTTTPTPPENPAPKDPEWELPPDAGTAVATTPDAAAEEPTVTPAAVTMPPVLQRPTFSKIGVGQRVSFGIPAIDHEGHTVAVSLVEKPASATYDPITLTVTWKPTKKERGKTSNFKVRVVQTHRLTKAQTSRDVTFGIEVTRRRQKLPRARQLDAAVEQLFTVHDRARLKRVNRAWTFQKMLHKATVLHWGKGKKVPKAKDLYRGFLSSQAVLHMNKRLDPNSPQFDKRSFGNPRDWKIVTVRTRLDKKWQEIRVVWQATKAPEPVFAMFRFRPTKGSADGLATGRDDNNAFFSKMVADTLLDKKGSLQRKHKRARAHGKAVAKLVNRVVNFKHKNPAYGATFLALATAARMGGGSARDDKGGYASGDGWAWSAMKPLETGGKIAFTNVPIKGFWTGTKPSADGTRWVAKCAERYAKGLGKVLKRGQAKSGHERLCRAKSQLVDLPAPRGDGGVKAGFREAANLYVEHKMVHSVKELALRDPRRDHGEEKGMTCSQCHTRMFGVRDWNDKAAASPKGGVPTKMNGTLKTTFFILVPTDRWSPYMLEFQKAQECLAKAEMERVLKRPNGLTCAGANP